MTMGDSSLLANCSERLGKRDLLCIALTPATLGYLKDSMADTRYLKSIVEDHVRTWLRDKFCQSFKSVFLPLVGVEGTARTHEFDAVSEDGLIVCSIKTASWKTSGRKRGDGKVGGVYRELYFLDHVRAQKK